MQTRSRHIWLGSCIGLLAGAASTAVVAWYFLSASGSPSTGVSPSAVCDVVSLGGDKMADPGYYTIRLVAYGDVDSDDDMPCGMLPDVRIAIIHEKRNEIILHNWWETVGGHELGIERFIPLGARVPSTADKLHNAPAQFITTGSDGTAEVTVPYDPALPDYSLCVISPVDDLIAGCSHDLYLSEPYLNPVTHVTPYHITVYIYFTHGHAVIETKSSDRYQRFLDGGGSSWEPAVVEFEAIDNDDIEPSRPYDDVDIIIIGGYHVNAWWAAVSDNGANELDTDRVFVGSEVLTHGWVHVTTTGQDGLAETALLPGDYLICPINWSGHPVCVYENLTSGHHKFYINFWWGGNEHSISKAQ